MLLVLLNLLLAAFAIVFALRCGGRVERYGAKLLVLMVILGVIAYPAEEASRRALELDWFSQDLVGFIGFSLLGIYSKRIWPLWAAAFQLLSVVVHGIMLFGIELRPIVFASMTSAPTWAVYLLLIAGTLGHQRQMRSSGNDHSSRD